MGKTHPFKQKVRDCCWSRETGPNKRRQSLRWIIQRLLKHQNDLFAPNSETYHQISWENSFSCHFGKSSLRAAVLPEDNVESIIIIPYARKQTKNHFPQPDFVLHFVAFSCMWVFNIVEITFIFAASAISAIKHLLNSWRLEKWSVDLQIFSLSSQPTLLGPDFLLTFRCILP